MSPINIRQLHASLTQVWLGVGIDIKILAPLHHTLQHRHQAFQAFDSYALFLDWSSTYIVQVKRNLITGYLKI